VARQFPIGSALPAELMAWLCAHAPDPIFSSPEWCEQLAAFKHTAQEPLARREFVWLVAYDGAAPVLAAALEISRERWGLCRLGLLNNYYTPWVGLFADAAVLAPEAAWRCLLRAVDQQFPGWLTFGAAPLDSASFARLQAACADQPYASFARQESVNQTAALASTAGYWQARPSRLRNTVRRKKKLLTGGPHQFELVRHPSAAQVAAYWTVYRQSWKPQEPSPCFIDWLIGWTAQRGMLRLGLLHIEGRPVACQMWFVEAGRAYIFKLAQTATADQYSPGTVLTALMVDALGDPEQLTHIDFLLGGDPFKQMWMDQQQPVFGVELVNRRPLAGKLLTLMYRLRAALKAGPARQ
jgi:CelD/BcsL family acetyltransferase involved in cellulose biosynthesis